MASSPRINGFRQSMLAAALGLACAPVAPAADFFVNSYVEDAHDLLIDDSCDATSGGNVCTLRAAIEEAVASNSDDRIFLGTGTTTLSIGPLPFHDRSKGSLALIGDGHEKSAIVGGSTEGGWMIISNGILALRGLRVADFSSEFTSAVSVQDANLTIEDARFEHNLSLHSGASIQATFSELMVRNTAFAFGEGLSGGEIEVDSSIFHCQGCIFEGARGYQGGAVYLGDELFPLNVLIEDSLFDGNQATDKGGAIYAKLAYAASSVVILNTTITGNTTKGDGGGVWAETAFQDVLLILSSTIAGNVANSELTGGERGGGIAVGALSHPVRVANSIVSGNRRCSAGTHQGGCTAYTADDCAGSILSNGLNIIRTVLAAQCTVSGAHSTSDPQLGPLAYNGGPTRTRAIQPGSPAIDAVNLGACGDGSGGFLDRDQRGGFRAEGSGCDLGAFEYGALIFDDDFELWEWKWSAVSP